MPYIMNTLLEWVCVFTFLWLIPGFLLYGRDSWFEFGKNLFYLWCILGAYVLLNQLFGGA